MLLLAAHWASRCPSTTHLSTCVQHRRAVVLTQPLKVRYGKVVDLEDQADGGMQVWSAEVTNSDRRQFSLNPAEAGSPTLAGVLAAAEERSPLVGTAAIDARSRLIGSEAWPEPTGQRPWPRACPGPVQRRRWPVASFLRVTQCARGPCS